MLIDATFFWQICDANIVPSIFEQLPTSQNWNYQIWIKIAQFWASDRPALKINFGPPTPNLWSDWSPQKRVNRNKFDQR